MYWILRFVLDALAYLLAIVAAMAFLIVLFLIRPEAAHMDPADKLFGLFLLVPVTMMRFARDAFLPALVVIAYAEWRAMRDWLFYALAGAGVAFVALLLRHWEPYGQVDQLAGWIMLAAAGAVAGTAYWLVAGWSAGIRRSPTSTAPGGS
jgi:hypothetical protein